MRSFMLLVIVHHAVSMSEFDGISQHMLSALSLMLL